MVENGIENNSTSKKHKEDCQKHDCIDDELLRVFRGQYSDNLVQKLRDDAAKERQGKTPENRRLHVKRHFQQRTPPFLWIFPCGSPNFARGLLRFYSVRNIIVS